MARNENILQIFGKTSLIQLNRLVSSDSNVDVKMQSFNLIGSINDAITLALIKYAECTGRMNFVRTIIKTINSTAGMGFTVIYVQQGYPFMWLNNLIK